MKESFIHLSTASQFFREKRFVFKGNKPSSNPEPKKLEKSAFDELGLDFKKPDVGITAQGADIIAKQGNLKEAGNLHNRWQPSKPELAKKIEELKSSDRFLKADYPRLTQKVLATLLNIALPVSSGITDDSAKADGGGTMKVKGALMSDEDIDNQDDRPLATNRVIGIINGRNKDFFVDAMANLSLVGNDRIQQQEIYGQVAKKIITDLGPAGSSLKGKQWERRFVSALGKTFNLSKESDSYISLLDK